MAAGLVVLGVGMGAAMTPATTAITEALPPSRQGVGSALNDLSREVGGAIGIAVIGSILTSTYSSHVNVSGLSGQVAAKVQGSFAVAAHLPAPIPDRAHAAFVTAHEHRAAHGRGCRDPRRGRRRPPAVQEVPARPRAGAGGGGFGGQPVASPSTAARRATAPVNACSGGLA